MAAHFQFGIDVFNQVIAWRITGHLSKTETLAAIAELKRAARSLNRGPKKVLIDYRGLSERGRPVSLRDDVTRDWSELEAWLAPQCSHMALLCNSGAMKHALDRALAGSAKHDVARAFYNPDAASALRQAYAFLGIETNEVVAA